MKPVLLILLLSVLNYPQNHEGLKNHPFSGTLVLSAGGGFSIGNTDIDDTKLGFAGLGMIEYFIPTNTQSSFGIRLQVNGSTISGGKTAFSPGYSTDIFSVGSGISYLYSVEDVAFPYLFGGISFMNFFTYTFNGLTAPNRELNLYKTNTFAYNVELGSRFLIAPDITLNVGINYNFPRSDYLEDIAYGDNLDKFLTVNGGLSISLFGNDDTDADGISDDIDICPGEAEDFDGFEDEDGCPEFDDDKDGINDARDQCPGLAEDFDGFQDDDGCPDTDNDNDGIADLKDNCPNVKEDFDGFQDDDGCPDFDNDKDGISDDSDKCKNSPEDLDGFEDADGCPDLDNDNDGILDQNDECPNNAETFNNFQDGDGCPDTVPLIQEPEKNNIPPQTSTPQPPVQRQQPPVQRKSSAEKTATNKFLLEEFLTFEDDNSTIKSQAYNELDKIAGIIKKNPQQKWRIEGHVDKGSLLPNIGGRRAREVMLYLVKKGVPLSQLEVVDLKDNYPRANNDRPSGRALNRRVEITRVK